MHKWHWRDVALCGEVGDDVCDGASLYAFYDDSESYMPSKVF